MYKLRLDIRFREQCTAKKTYTYIKKGIDSMI